MPIPPTVAALELVLTRLLKGYWSRCGLDVTTVNGANADVAVCIAVACRVLEIPLLDFTRVQDADLVPITSDQYEAIVDVGEWRGLLTAKASWGYVDQMIGGNQIMLGQMSKQLDADIERKGEYIKNTYGIGAAALFPGNVDLDFQVVSDDAGNVLP